MKTKLLIELGIPSNCISVAIEAIKNSNYKFENKKNLQSIIGNVARSPAEYKDDKIFGSLAEAIIKSQEKIEVEASNMGYNPYRKSAMAPYQIWGDIDEDTLAQLEAACSLPIAVQGASMPDAHKGYGIGIGGVLATHNSVIPYAVGVDIACRVKLSVLDLPAKKIDDVFSPKIDPFIRALTGGTVFGVGKTQKFKANHNVMDQDWNVCNTTRTMKDKAWSQLGTSGSGNHFAEFGILTLEKAELGLEPGTYIALLSHSGSRGTGAAVCKTYSDIAMGKLPKVYAQYKQLAWLSLDSEAGQEYWNAMNLMGEYASANHAVIHERVTDLLGAKVIAGIENHHNFCIPASERIQTPTGPKHITELHAGDKVYAFDENKKLTETNIIKVWHSGKKSIYTIKTAHRKLRVSGDHPIKSENGDWVKASNLKPGDKIMCVAGYYDRRIGLQNGEARFIGAYLGDGWIRSNPKRQGYTFGLAIGDENQSHTHEYVKLMLSLRIPDVVKKTWKSKNLNLNVSTPGAFGITGSHKGFYNYILSWGLGKESTERRLPTFLFSATEKDKIELLSGYFDADGSIGCAVRKDASGLIRACSEGLVHDIREIAISIGMDCTPVRQKSLVTNYGETICYMCNVSPISMKRLNLWHKGKDAIIRSANPRLLREYSNNYFAETIQSITITAEEDVYDLTVDHESHSFICSGVVVHNCWKETHNGRELYVHRKGATPAGKNVLGIIPGSMADPCYVVRGKGKPESLMSASHGAGRAMSRTQAIKTFNWANWKSIIKGRGVRLLAAGLDEVPGAYKSILSVMAAQTDLVSTIARFDPKIVQMCGDGSKAED